MAANSTLKMLDELEKTTQDFLSELTDMESKRGRTSNKKTVIGRTEKFEPATEQGASLPEVPPSTDGEEYRMKHPRRGECLIFVYKNFLNLNYRPRPSAKEDSEVCKEAFQALKFEVEVFENLKTEALRAELKKASERDHSNCDTLAVVFMSHGNLSKDGREELITYDSTIYTAELWQHFAYCPSLEGKPKLFFIQACRGDDMEQPVSVGLMVSTDSSSAPPSGEGNLRFDSPDILVMQSSYEGMVSFRARPDIKVKGSVFIHFLAQILQEKGGQKDLSELLLEVSRRVALDYEAKSYKDAKQMPQSRSTLTKRITL